MLKINYKKLITYLFLLIVIFLLDRGTKLYVIKLAEINDLVDIYLNSYLNIYLIWNTGIAFGLLSLDQSLLYNLITLIIIGINILILVMILGGSIGNLFDRVYYKAVPDFIDIHHGDFHWFVFNVADIFITIGVVCLILNEIFINNVKKNENK